MWCSRGMGGRWVFFFSSRRRHTRWNCDWSSDVCSSDLHTGLASKSPGIRDRGVKKAPFVVLIGANMPSILAEISFISNPGDEKRLRNAEYRQRIAESLYRGISRDRKSTRLNSSHSSISY